MTMLNFDCEGIRLFTISAKNIPLVGDLVTFNTGHYRVYSIRHRYADRGHDVVVETGVTVVVTKVRSEDVPR